MVEQRLKQVVVLAIDQGDLDGCLGEPFRGGQAAEPGANNDHVRPAAHAATRHGPQPGRIRRLIRAKDHASLPALAIGCRCRPERDCGVELPRMEGARLESCRIASTASEPPGAIKEPWGR